MLSSLMLLPTAKKTLSILACTLMLIAGIINTKSELTYFENIVVQL